MSKASEVLEKLNKIDEAGSFKATKPDVLIDLNIDVSDIIKKGLVRSIQGIRDLSLSDSTEKRIKDVLTRAAIAQDKYITELNRSLNDIKSGIKKEIDRK